MKSGKKHVVERTIFRAFNRVKTLTGKPILHTFINILIQFRPLFGFISKRFGKQFKKIPVPLYPRRQTIMSLK
jgi:ribosomal protein S7